MQLDHKKRQYHLGIVAAILLPAICLPAGCSLSPSTGQTQSGSFKVALISAPAVEARFKLNAGDLTLRGNSTAEGASAGLMDFSYSYNVDSWKPNVVTSSAGLTGTLLVTQVDPASDFSISDKNLINKWDVKLDERTPFNLSITMGAANGTLDLSHLALHGLQIASGAGAVDLNLGGNYPNGVRADLACGAGDLNIMLPSTMAARVHVTNSTGKLIVEGLQRSRDIYTNGISSGPVLDVWITGGLGDITLSKAK